MLLRRNLSDREGYYYVKEAEEKAAVSDRQTGQLDRDRALAGDVLAAGVIAVLALLLAQLLLGRLFHLEVVEMQPALGLLLVARPPSSTLALAGDRGLGRVPVPDRLVALVQERVVRDAGHVNVVLDLLKVPSREGVDLDQAGRVDLERLKRGTVRALGAAPAGDDSLDVQFAVRAAGGLDLMRGNESTQSALEAGVGVEQQPATRAIGRARVERSHWLGSPAPPGSLAGMQSGIAAHLDKVVVRVLIRLPQLLAVPVLKLFRGLNPWRTEDEALCAVLLLELVRQREGLLEVVERVEEDDGHEVLGVGRVRLFADLADHVQTGQACQSERCCLVQPGQVCDGPAEDLLRRRLGQERVNRVKLTRVEGGQGRGGRY